MCGLSTSHKQTNRQTHIKGMLTKFQVNPHLKMFIPDSQRYPFNLLMNSNEEDITITLIKLRRHDPWIKHIFKQTHI